MSRQCRHAQHCNAITLHPEAREGHQYQLCGHCQSSCTSPAQEHMALQTLQLREVRHAVGLQHHLEVEPTLKCNSTTAVVPHHCVPDLALCCFLNNCFKMSNQPCCESSSTMAQRFSQPRLSHLACLQVPTGRYAGEAAITRVGQTVCNTL